MPTKHIVEAGEHLGSIAHRFGFANFSVLWEHPANARLKALRKEPTLLASGDEVFIPDRVRLVFERLTDSSHDFRINVDTLTLTIRLLDLDGKPRKNTPVIVRVEEPENGAASRQSERKLVTDADGNVTVGMATHVNSGSIEVDGVTLPLLIGGLEPIDTDSGITQRLRNLGYLPLDEELDPTQLELAVEDFQVDNELEMTGDPADIRDKLKEVYGG
jgi:hypothetical protein